MWILVNTKTQAIVKHGKMYYANRSAAKAALTRLHKQNKIVLMETIVMDEVHYNPPKKTVINLMTGLPVEIDVNTPHCCDPSTETYWSM